MSNGTVQPAQVWLFERPGTGTPVRSEEVRNNFNAIGRLFFTDNADYPENPRNGMPRVLAQDPNNVRFQVWFNNAWRTIFQNIQRGIPAPAQLVATVESPGLTTWTIDHNLGVKPIVQVFDELGNMLEATNLDSPPRATIPLTNVPDAVLTSLAGTTVLHEWIATYRGSVVDLLATVSEAITGTPDFTVDITIGGTPMTGGDIAVTATQTLGTRLSGGTPTADNEFEVGDSVQMRITMNTAPTAGALILSLDTQRALRTGQYLMQHVDENRVVITHPAQQAGFATIVG